MSHFTLAVLPARPAQHRAPGLCDAWVLQSPAGRRGSPGAGGCLVLSPPGHSLVRAARRLPSSSAPPPQPERASLRAEVPLPSPSALRLPGMRGSVPESHFSLESSGREERRLSPSYRFCFLLSEPATSIQEQTHNRTGLEL